MTAKAKPLTVAQYQALQSGLPTFCPNAVFTIAGQTYTVTQVIALLIALLNAKLAAAPAKAAWLAATQAVEATEAQEGQTVKGVRDVVALMFENAPTTLASFAIVPRKTPAPLSAEARVAANAKRQATRKARGITSKKQKALITGNVTGVTITPTTTSSSATPAASPATPAVPAAASGSTPHA
jgi:hypothetical protein